MKKISLFLTQEITLVVIFSTAILFLSFYYLFYYLSVTPAGTVFPLVHNYLFDYNYYLHLMRQSFEGRWLFITRYTPEVFPARFVYLTFLLLGKLARIFGSDLPFTYTLSRLILAVFFLFLIYWLIRLVYPLKNQSRIRLLSFFLTLFGTGFWTAKMVEGKLVIGRFLSFWTEADPIERLVYLPHHLFAKVLMLASLLLLVGAIEKKNKALLIPATITAFLCGLSSPYVYVNLAITVVITLIIYTVLKILPNKRGKTDRKNIIKAKPKETISECELPKKTTDHIAIGYLAQDYHNQNIRRATEKFVSEDLPQIFIFIFSFLFFSSLSLLYLRRVENSGFPWNHYLSWEQMVFPISLSDYFFFSGPNLILSLFAVSAFLKSRRFIHLLILSWLIESWIGIFFLSRFLPLQNVRFLAGSYFIPLGVLAGYGIEVLAKRINKWCSRDLSEARCNFRGAHTEGLYQDGILKQVQDDTNVSTQDNNALSEYCNLALKKITSASLNLEKSVSRESIILALLLLPCLFIFSVNIWSNLKGQLAAFNPMAYNIFLPHELLLGFAYLDKSTPSDSVVLSQGYTSNLLPAYTHNKTVLGHFLNTYNVAEKEEGVTQFFAQKDFLSARDFLKSNNVSYVFYSFDTDLPVKAFIKNLNLTKLYQNGRVVIFQVN